MCRACSTLLMSATFAAYSHSKGRGIPEENNSFIRAFTSTLVLLPILIIPGIAGFESRYIIPGSITLNIFISICSKDSPRGLPYLHVFRADLFHGFLLLKPMIHQ